MTDKINHTFMSIVRSIRFICQRVCKKVQQTSFISIFSMGALTLTLALSLVFYSMLMGLSKYTNMSDDSQVTIFLAPTANEQQRNDLISKLKENDSLTNISVLTPEEGINILTRDMTILQKNDFADYNPLPYVIEFKYQSNQMKFIHQIQQIGYVDSVQYNFKNNISTNIKYLLYLLIAFTIFIASFIIYGYINILIAKYKVQRQIAHTLGLTRYMNVQYYLLGIIMINISLLIAYLIRAMLQGKMHLILQNMFNTKFIVEPMAGLLTYHVVIYSIVLTVIGASLIHDRLKQ